MNTAPRLRRCNSPSVRHTPETGARTVTTDIVLVVVRNNSADDGHDDNMVLSNSGDDSHGIRWSTATVVILDMVSVMVHSNSGDIRYGVSLSLIHI